MPMSWYAQGSGGFSSVHSSMKAAHRRPHLSHRWKTRKSVALSSTAQSPVAPQEMLASTAQAQPSRAQPLLRCLQRCEDLLSRSCGVRIAQVGGSGKPSPESPKKVRKVKKSEKSEKSKKVRQSE
eukprot:scaffold7881_cov258-Pinguiococcus_pyrenoidosus.AAC.8